MAVKETKYKAFNITQAEVEAIRAGLAQMSDAVEGGADEEATAFFNKDIGHIYSFLKRLKIQ